MDKLPDLPPTIELLLREGLQSLVSVDALAKLLKGGFLHALRTQAEFSLGRWSYSDAQRVSPTGELVVVPSGALSPFTSSQKCAAISCRIDSARAFAKTIGLYSDYAIVPDLFSGLVLSEEDPDVAARLFDELSVLNELLPLVREGIIRFGRPGMPLREEHAEQQLKKTRETVRQATHSLVEAVAKGFRLVLREVPGPVDHLVFENPILRGPNDPLNSHILLPKARSRRIVQMYRRRAGGVLPREATKMLLPLMEEALETDVEDLLLQLMLAERAHAILTTGSHMDALLLRHVRSPISARETEDWERIRTVQLPWVKDLGVAEVVQLRHEARLALPRLRSFLSTRLGQGDAAQPDGVEVARELEAEAAQIQGELEAWRKAYGPRFALGFGALGIGLVVYGLAHDAMMAAGAAVFSGIGKVYGELLTEKIETAKLRSRPSFVLLQARELLKHRSH